MADKSWTVRVFIKAATSGDPGVEDHTRRFSVKGSHADKAATIARARLEELGAEVVSLSHAPERVIIATVSREPRKGPPTTLVAHLERPTKAYPIGGTRKKGAGR